MVPAPLTKSTTWDLNTGKIDGAYQSRAQINFARPASQRKSSSKSPVA